MKSHNRRPRPEAAREVATEPSWLAGGVASEAPSLTSTALPSFINPSSSFFSFPTSPTHRLTPLSTFSAVYSPAPPLPRSPIPSRRKSSERGKEGKVSMSAMVASSSLNPDAPLFIPAAFWQVEDFSPQWWDLVKSTAWFRDHWFHQHQQLDDMADSLLAFEGEDDVAGLLPDAIDDDDDLFYEHHNHNLAVETAAQQPPAALNTGAVLKVLSLASPKGGNALRGFPEKPRYSEKPTKYAVSPRSGAAPRLIHQPR